MTWILVLIFSPFHIDSWSFADREHCLAKAKELIGTEMKVTAWDAMNGSNPIPKVKIAYCAEGYGQP